jgi:alanine dehydrogenase
MLMGVPKEIKNHECRIDLTPDHWVTAGQVGAIFL